MLVFEDFDEWFAAVNQENSPYQWQRELAQRVVESGRWPEAIAAPTGSGKSAVIDIHAFAVALAHARGTDPRPPRRLCHVVGRRALVDDAATRARHIRNVLNEALESDGDAVVERVARSLRALSADKAPLEVSVIRGGIAPERGWQDDVLTCQVICATPDMFGSRLLFRGYGSSSGMRPREAGMVAYDSVVVLDEAHLNQQLVKTARRVAELAGESPVANVVSPLQVVETTATPLSANDGSDAIGVRWDSLDDDPANETLVRRLTRPKPITLRKANTLTGLTGAKRTAAVNEIVELTRTAISAGQTPVGVVLNRVDSAIEVYESLKEIPAFKADEKITLLVGPRRVWEQQLDREKSAPLVFVATQTIEVGVDLDFGALITDLAPGAAIVQRAGRLNRTGRRDNAPLTVLVPDNLDRLRDADALPYSTSELRESYAWLTKLQKTANGLSPTSIAQESVPNAKPKRLHFSALDEARAELLSHTSEQLILEPDLTFWLNDSLKSDVGVAVVGRNLPRECDKADAPFDISESISLLNACPPQPHEAYPTTINKVRELLPRLKRSGFPAFVQEAGSWMETEADSLYSGAVICLPAEVAAARAAVFLLDGKDPLGEVLDPRDSYGCAKPLPDNHATKRSTALVVGHASAGLPEHIKSSVLEVCAELQSSSTPPTVEKIYSKLVDRGQQEYLTNYLGLESDLRGQDGAEVRVTVGSPCPEQPALASWVVFDQLIAGVAEDDSLSTINHQRPVLLSTHQQDVANRAALFAERLGLTPRLIEILRLAGQHHDDGKADERFQNWLKQTHLERSEDLVAKSTVKGLSRRQRNYLPAGWRHEQMSVALTLETAPETDPLALRLIGTSHGHGRALFVMNHEDLLPKDAPEALVTVAKELFTVGHWEAIVDSTNREWGLWGAAFLESVLRSADVSVSKEGR